MSTYSNSAREVEMPDGNVVVLHSEPTGGANTTSNIKKFKYDDNGHVTESTAADAEDLNLSSYSTPTTGTTAIGTSDDIQTAIGKLDHQSHIDQTNILSVQGATEELVDNGAKNKLDVSGMTTITMRGITFSQSNGVITASGNNDNTGGSYVDIATLSGDQMQALKGHILSGSVKKSGYLLFISRKASPGNTVVTSDSGSPSDPIPDNIDYECIVTVYIPQGATQSTPTYFYPMICSEAEWKASQQFEPHALGNQYLTPALIECVDEGVKNLLDIDKVTDTDNNVTVSKSNSGFTITSTDQYAFHAFMLTLQAGVYYLSADISALSGSNTCSVYVRRDNVSGDYIGYQRIMANGKIAIRFTVDQPRTIAISFYASDRTYVDTTTYTVSNLMISDKVKYDISPNYASYALPNTDLTQEVNTLHERTDQIQEIARFRPVEPNWYRVFEMKSISTATAAGASDNSCSIVIERDFANDNNEHHEIKLMAIYPSISEFTNELSKSNFLLITAIRQVVTDNSTYIDIYYAGSGSSGNNIACAITNNFDVVDGQARWRAVKSLLAVPESATGETVVVSHNFDANYEPPRIIYKSANPDVDTTEAIVSELTYSIPANYMARVSISETYDSVHPTKLRLAQDANMTSTENYKEPANSGDGISMVAVYRAGYQKTIYVSTAAIGSGKNRIDMIIELFKV